MTHGTFNSSFRSTPWLPGGHSQTLWRKFAGAKIVEHRRERIELADGDFIDLDWAEPTNARADNGGPIVLIIHGLCGCSESSYVLALQTQLLAKNLSSVVMNLRGCSGDINRKARAYHSGVSDDLAEIFTHLASQYPQRDFITVGYSLGANVMLKWLGELGAANNSLQPIKAVAVSTPFTLALCSEAMLSGFSRIYGRYFTKRLLAEFERKKEFFHGHEDKRELAKLEALQDTASISSIWEFDDRITAPLHGYSSAKDYYQQCSSINFLSAINTETLLIQSHDDPMIPPAALPAVDEVSNSVHLELSRRGGHVGFVAGNAEQWLEQRILGFIVAP